MARREAYSKVSKENRIRADHAVGMGDVLLKQFQCLNPYCTNTLIIENELIEDDYRFNCAECNYTYEHNGAQKFYTYSMDVLNEEYAVYESTEKGDFLILHDEYLEEALEVKYCIVCNTIKPLDFFDNHRRRKTKKQSECRMCKKEYNAIKNATRTSDQHRESGQSRRLLIDVSGSHKVDSNEIYDRFQHSCFNCHVDLSEVDNPLDKPIDHTLPVYYLWPLSTETGTLLCRRCNGRKSGKWPSDFYSYEQLKSLSILTGIDLKLLSGDPIYNPEALKLLQDSEEVDRLLNKYANYLRELALLRNRLLKDTGLDFFRVSKNISSTWIDQADTLY